MRKKEYRSEEEILFGGQIVPDSRRVEFHPGTTFAGTGKVCSESLTPDPVKAKRLRMQKYW